MAKEKVAKTVLPYPRNRQSLEEEIVSFTSLTDEAGKTVVFGGYQAMNDADSPTKIYYHLKTLCI